MCGPTTIKVRLASQAQSLKMHMEVPNLNLAITNFPFHPSRIIKWLVRQNA